jgi:3-deoxy-7-phosphoheptulonate synthase
VTQDDHGSAPVADRVTRDDHDVDWRTLPALQQPDWRGHPHYREAFRALTAALPLVLPGEVREFAGQMALVCAGGAQLLQAGDCAESFHESGPEHTEAAVDVLDRLADVMGARSGHEVVRIGRLGGQFAKPRSQASETVDGVTLPPFRGHLINSELPDPVARVPDPRRMLTAHRLAAEVHRMLAERRCLHADKAGPWSSHEALVIDYEAAFAHQNPETGRPLLCSTHFPWIGERTRQVDNAQVRLLAATDNPVGCKLGPTTTAEEAVRLCELLNPDRVPGRLTFIVRMGAATVATGLPPILRAVRGIGHPVVWVSDPMHGNTERTPDGGKTRRLDAVAAEIAGFRRALSDAGEHVGGLHLEVATAEVGECVGGPDRAVADTDRVHRTLCDPRLSPSQAEFLLGEAWA